MNRQVGAKTMPRSHGWQIALLVAAILCAAFWMATGAAVMAQAGYEYTVLEGDNWDTVASRTGVSVDALQQQTRKPQTAKMVGCWSARN